MRSHSAARRSSCCSRGSLARVRERRRPDPQRLAIAFAAGVAAVLAFGKVLSPQYAEWLAVPRAAGRRRSRRRGGALAARPSCSQRLWFHHYDRRSSRSRAPSGWSCCETSRSSRATACCSPCSSAGIRYRADDDPLLARGGRAAVLERAQPLPGRARASSPHARGACSRSPYAPPSTCRRSRPLPWTATRCARRRRRGRFPVVFRIAAGLPAPRAARARRGDGDRDGRRRARGRRRRRPDRAVVERKATRSSFLRRSRRARTSGRGRRRRSRVRGRARRRRLGAAQIGALGAAGRREVSARGARASLSSPRAPSFARRLHARARARSTSRTAPCSPPSSRRPAPRCPAPRWRRRRRRASGRRSSGASSSTSSSRRAASRSGPTTSCGAIEA